MTYNTHKFDVEFLWLPSTETSSEIKDLLKSRKDAEDNHFLKKACVQQFRHSLSKVLDVFIDLIDVRAQTGADVKESSGDVKRVKSPLNYNEGIFRVLCRLHLRVKMSNSFSKLVSLYCNSRQNFEVPYEAWLHFDITKMYETRMRQWSDELKFSHFSMGNLVGLQHFVEHFNSNTCFPEGLKQKITQVRGKFYHLLQRFEVCFVVGRTNVVVRKRTCETHRWHKLVIGYSSLKRVLICHDETFCIYFHFLESPLLYSLKPIHRTDENGYVIEDDFESMTFPDLNNTYVEWLRVLNLCEGLDLKREFSMNTVLKIEFKNPDYDTIISFLKMCKHAVVYFTPVKCVKAQKTLQIQGISATGNRNMSGRQREAEYNCFYALKCILTRSNELIDQFSVFKNLDKINQYLGEKFRQNPQVLADVLTHIYFSLDQGNILLFPTAVKVLYDKLCKEQDPKHDDNADYTKNRIVYVKKAILMPTHVRFCPQLPSMFNRMLRKGNPSHFLRVVLRDTNLQKLNFSTKTGNSRVQKNHQRWFFNRFIKTRLTKGIDLGGRHYYYLGASTSQMRSHSLWCYAKDSELRTAESIRKEIGHLDIIQEVPKYMARMGQSFSQAMGNIIVDQKYTNLKNPEPDVVGGDEKVYMSDTDDDDDSDGSEKRKFLPGVENEDKEGKDQKGYNDIIEDDPYNFSDGIGRMSTKIAEEIYEKLDLSEERPTAVQIRYAGCKGMLLLDPTLEGKQISFRESMQKYQGFLEDNSLEILKTSKPRSVHLNQHLITILDQKEVAKEVFFRLQKEMICNLIKSLFYDENAEHLLNSFSQLRSLNYKDMFLCGISFTEDPFFRSMIISIFKQQIYLLKTKCRIALPVDKARNMFGVMDETRTLEYNEVFVQYTKWDSKETEILEGTVMVTKNPCMQLGDVRKFRAVNVETLHHVKDCIVFPAKGPRPHPDEMAGSDLDGDEYDIIWLEDLIFDGDNSPAMHFAVPKTLQLKRENPVQVSEELDHMRDYILNNIVGIIANAHLVFADSLGLDNKKCKRLAKKYSKALDFAKSGNTSAMRSSDFASSYPDFMEKGEKTTYLSKNALGYLYRNVKSLATGLEATADNMQYDRDESLVHDHWQKYETSALKTYSLYHRRMDAWLKEYGLENEGSLLSGNFIVTSKLYMEREDKHNLIEVLESQVLYLYKQLEKEFFAEFGGRCPPQEFTEEMLQKASAWYVVSYPRKQDVTSVSYHGMPWAVADVLVELKKKKTRKFCINASIFNKKSTYIEERLNKCIEDQVPCFNHHSEISTYKYEVLDMARTILGKWLTYQKQNFSICQEQNIYIKQLDEEFEAVSSKLLSCDDKYVMSVLESSGTMKILSPAYYVIETLIQIANMGSYQDPHATYSDSLREFGMFAWVTLIKLACSCDPQYLGIEESSNPPLSLYAIDENVMDNFVYKIGNDEISEKFRDKIFRFEEEVQEYLKQSTKVKTLHMSLDTSSNKSTKTRVRYYNLKIMAEGSRFSIERLRKLVVNGNFEKLVVESKPSSSSPRIG